jgi:hypothetical protein
MSEKNRSLKIYNEIIKHLEEHLNEVLKGDEQLDPKDLEHYNLLSNEIKRLKGGAFSSELKKWSNPRQAQKMAIKYLGENAKLYESYKPNKKYMIRNPETNEWVHFGQLGYQDFTKSRDLDQRNRYLARATNIKGNWRDNPYSPNNLSIKILW